MGFQAKFLESRQLCEYESKINALAIGGYNVIISTGTPQNGVVGLAPFHDWDTKIPADLKPQIQKARDGIKDGSIKIDLSQLSKISSENTMLTSIEFSTFFVIEFINKGTIVTLRDTLDI